MSIHDYTDQQNETFLIIRIANKLFCVNFFDGDCVSEVRSLLSDHIFMLVIPVVSMYRDKYIISV